MKIFVLILLSVFALDSVDYINPYAGGIPLPRFNVPTFPYIGLPGGGLRVYPPRTDFTTDFLRGVPVGSRDFKSGSIFTLSPQQATDSTLIKVIDYSFDLERVTPYNYSVYLDESQIRVSLAVAQHSAVDEIVYENNGNNYLVLNPSGTAQITVSYNEQSKAVTVSANSNNYNVYLEFETAPQTFGELNNNVANYHNAGFTTGNAVVFNFGAQKTVHLKYGVSTQSIDAARAFLQAEIPDFSVGDLSVKGRAAWTQTLSKFTVSGGVENDLRLFFTAVYRTYESITQSYSVNTKDNHYVDPFLSKSYEALHPLLSVIEPEMEAGFIRGMLEKIEASTKQLSHTNPRGSYEDLLEYYRVAGVVHNAYLRGILGTAELNHAFTVLKAHNDALSESGTRALRAARIANGPSGQANLLVSSADHPAAQHAFYSERGYFPFVDAANKASRSEKLARLSNEAKDGDKGFFELTRSFTQSFEHAQKTVEVTLAAAASDYYMAQLALALEKQHTLSNGASSSFFLNRSRNYRALFNSERSRFEPRDEDGVFVQMSRSVRELVSAAAGTHTRHAAELKAGEKNVNVVKVKANNGVDLDLDAERVYITNPYSLPHNLTDAMYLFAQAANNGAEPSEENWLSLGRKKLEEYVESVFRHPPRHPQFDHLNFIPREQTMGVIGSEATAQVPSLRFLHIYSDIARAAAAAAGAKKGPRMSNALNWKTQKQVHFNLRKNYRNDLEGIPQDYDGGNMYAGVVWAGLGLYPGNGDLYTIGTPWFTNATVALDANTQFSVVATNWSANNKYIHSATWKGSNFAEESIPRTEVGAGGALTFVMGEKPLR